MSRWIPVADESEIPPGGFKLVHVDDLDLAIFNVDGNHASVNVSFDQISAVMGAQVLDAGEQSIHIEDR